MSKTEMATLAQMVAEMVTKMVVEQISELDSREEKPTYMTTTEVATMTGLKKGTLERYRAVRKGPRYLKAGANVRYLAAHVREWMEEQPLDQ